MATYLLGFVAVDFSVGVFFNDPQVHVRKPHYHHGLPNNFDGRSKWGAEFPEMTTNSLGMRDCCARQVAPRQSRHRILFIGDSFTEGVGVKFDGSFVGHFGDQLEEPFPDQIEF